MTIRRHYSLPNCKLVLEGLSNETISSNLQNGRPLMSILTNAECHFVGSAQPLNGGRVFFESLVKAVSAYAQEFLSGLRHPQETAEGNLKVYLERIQEKNQHRLTLEPAPESNEEKVEIDLTTIQFFDLVEAIDQFFADTRTLPDLSLDLQPVSRRYRGAEEPLVKRATPAALGMGGLALAASALFFLPIPEVREPEPVSQSNSSDTTPETTESPQTSASPTPSPSSSVTSSALSPEQLEAALGSAPEITNATELRFIERYLQKTINQVWQDKSEVNQKLQFRVSVTRDGSIIDYEGVRGTPTSAAEKTPLSDLRYLPTIGHLVNSEEIAPFLIVFNRSRLEISPWRGYQGEKGFGPEITDSEKLRQLNEQLSQTIRDNWNVQTSSSKDLIYRVGVTENGAIADYEANNQAAIDYVEETPLPNLLKPEAAGIRPGGSLVPQQPLGQFKLIFKPSGRIEVSPWRGF
ncbi:MAG: DUF4335 domain-containing protein [Moorea sp. SIO2B7]|nr:DUF4335 domain-containing protein [Moorena sp. SIO2B7]